MYFVNLPKPELSRETVFSFLLKFENTSASDTNSSLVIPVILCLSTVALHECKSSRGKNKTSARQPSLPDRKLKCTRYMQAQKPRLQVFVTFGTGKFCTASTF